MKRIDRERRAARHAAEREELAQLRRFRAAFDQHAHEALAQEPQRADFADSLDGLSAWMAAALAWGREAAIRARMFESGMIQRESTDALAQAMRERDDYRARKDEAYLERNRVVALLARLFPSGIARTAIEGWDEEWHGCVFIDLPTGQVSWHYHDSQALLFADLPPYTRGWDGHDTAEKYSRVSQAAALLAAQLPSGRSVVPEESTDAHGPARTDADEKATPASYAMPGGRYA